MYDNIKPSTYVINNNAGSCMAMELPSPNRPPQIEIEYMELQGSIDALLEKMSVLNSRLRAVTRDGQPKPEENEKIPNMPLVPLAENIRRLRYKVAQGHGIIDDLMERLEI